MANIDVTHVPLSNGDTGIFRDQDAIRKTSQTLTDSEKTQARSNIGAASTDGVIAAAGDIIVTVSLAANTSSQSFTPTHDANIAKLTTNHIVEPNSYILSNPAAMTAGWSVNTDNAPTSITITGTPASATSLTLFFRLKQ